NTTDPISLFITRVSTNVYEVGWMQNGVRHVVTANSTVFQPYNFSTNVPGAAIGFYADVRTDLASSPVGLDNLHITSGTAFNTVSIAGDLSLTATGRLGLDVSEFDFTALDVSGSANLAGTLSVNLLNGFMPQEGASYAFLS